jgi:hypothetical protein
LGFHRQGCPERRIAAQDIIPVVCRLSKMRKKELAWWAEDSRVVAELLRLRVRMRLLKRPMRVLDG